ncbi:hypothetical protein PoB_002970700 [Plakobranchus ocellatus]|uniref:Uncharacterized protein n=1 Tax=Plakobranchus ocellatus TaxID=259542 RepID=A0AAV4A7E4_9GAST|nr:hypothetical protein PoB_002970700 [Plakobranchus ocellatus]
MSWPDFISHVSATTAKVDKVLVYDPSGYPVAVTEGVEVSTREGRIMIFVVPTGVGGIVSSKPALRSLGSESCHRRPSHRESPKA